MADPPETASHLPGDTQVEETDRDSGQGDGGDKDQEASFPQLEMGWLAICWDGRNEKSHPEGLQAWIRTRCP